MKLNVAVQCSLLNPVNNLVVAIYDASAPTVLLESQAPTKPYGNPFEITFAYNLQQDHIYIVKVWESANDVPAGVVRNSTNVTANTNSITFRDDLHLWADQTPNFASGGTDYDDASFLGWTWSLEEANTGTLDPGTTVEQYDQKDTGGFSLKTGETIQPGQHFIVKFQPQISVSNQDTPSIISSGIVISNTTTLDQTSVNKELAIVGAVSWFIITLPSLAVIGDYQTLEFISAGGSHINVSIRCAGGDQIQLNTLVSKIVLAQNEQLIIYKARGKWQVRFLSPAYYLVGQLVSGYTINEPNCYYANGDLISRQIYERLHDRANIIGMIDQSLWGAVDGFGNFYNKARYGTGNSMRFQLPDLRSVGFRRAGNSSTTSAGEFHDLMMLNHEHATLTGELGIYGIKPGKGPGGDYSNYSPTNKLNDLTSPPTDAAGNILTRVGNENRPAYTIEYVSIRF